MISDIIRRELQDEPMPGCPRTTPTLPFAACIVSRDPLAMQRAMVAAGVTEPVEIVRLPRRGDSYDEALAPIFRRHDLVVVDDLAMPLPTRRVALGALRSVCSRQALWVCMPPTRLSLIDDMSGVIESGLGLDEHSWLVVGLAPRRGVPSPPPLVADVVGGRLSWIDPWILHRQASTDAPSQLASLIATGDTPGGGGAVGPRGPYGPRRRPAMPA